MQLAGDRRSGPIGARPGLTSLGVASVLAGWLIATPAEAAFISINVTTQTDDADPGDGVCEDASGNCSLLAAIQEAGALAGADIIDVPVGQYDRLPAGTLDVSDISFQIAGHTGITRIRGQSADQTFLDGQDSGLLPLFNVLDTVHGPASLALDDLTIHNATHGALATGEGGGAVRIRGSAVLTNVVIRDSQAAHGGAIGSYGNYATTLLRVSLIDNHATVNGGAIEYSNALTLDDVTINGNSAAGFSAAIHCIFSNCASYGLLTINNSTVVYNNAMGGQAVNFGHNAEVSNSILAENRNLPDGRLKNCDGPGSPNEVVSGGYTFIQGGAQGGWPCGSQPIWDDGTNVIGLGGFVSDIVPRLAPVADNGGGMLTNALLSASIGVDDGDPVAPGAGTCLPSDSHITARPQDGDGDGNAYCDMGNFELSAPADSADLAITKVATESEVSAGGAVEYTITATNNGPDAVASAWVVDRLPVFVESATWTCSPSGGASCSASGSGDIADEVALPVSATVTYTLSGTVAGDIPWDDFDNHAFVGTASAYDTVPGNNGETENVTISDNAAPMATDDGYSVLEDATLTANDADGSIGDASDDGVLANDTDDDAGDTLTVSDDGVFTAGGIGGGVDLEADGTFVFTPDANDFGDATFSYTVTDGSASDQGDVTITVVPVNDAPSVTAGADISEPGGTFGSVLVNSWVGAVGFGPNEGAQSVADYLLSVDSDPAGVVRWIDVLNSGTLEADLSGASGTAQVSIRVQDDGGTSNGGVDTSPAAMFSVEVAAPEEDVSVNGETLLLDQVIEACGTLTVDATSVEPGVHIVFRGPVVVIGNDFEIGEDAHHRGDRRAAGRVHLSDRRRAKVLVVSRRHVDPALACQDTRSLACPRGPGDHSSSLPG